MERKKHKGSNTATAVRVLVVDDHPLVRDWLSRLINQEHDLITCGEAADRPGAIEALQSCKPDMVITDLSFNNGTVGIELIKDIKLRTPSLPVLVLSMHDETAYAERALHAGASGYVSKQANPAVILEAVRKVAGGEISLSKEMAATVLKKFANGCVNDSGGGIGRLSDRELEVFELLGHCIATQEIAGNLSLSVKTVETYKTRLKEKLALGNAHELLQHAVQWVLSQGS